MRTISAIAALILVAGSCVAFKPGSTGYSATWLSVLGGGAADPYELLEPTAYWYPSADLNNADRILGIASTNTVNAASVTTNGWEFNGTSQYLDMGFPPEIELDTNLLYSMAVWVWAPAANDSTRGIMGKTFQSNGDRWGINANSSQGHRAFIEEGGVQVAVSGLTGYQSNIWYHLVMTVDRSQPNNFFFYRDGVLTGSASYQDTDPVTYDGGFNVPFRFGSFNQTFGQPGFYWNGYIDQAAVWNGRALTSNEVFNLFENTRSGRK